MSTHTSPYGPLTQEGPSVAIATLCGSTSSEDKGSTLILREVAPTGGFHRSTAQTVKVKMTFVLVLVSPRAGRHKGHFLVATPSGRIGDSGEFDIEIKEGKAARMTFNVPNLEHVGQHWFNVVIDGVVVSRYPFDMAVEGH